MPPLCPPEGCPHYGLHLCAVWVHVCARPCAACHHSYVYVASWAVCHRLSACVGVDGSILLLPDHLWVSMAIPSVSWLGSVCQHENYMHLLVPAHLWQCPSAPVPEKGVGCH